MNTREPCGVAQNEKSLADTYLIEDGAGTVIKVTYRKNLLDKSNWSGGFPSQLEGYTAEMLKDRAAFREFVAVAEENGYFLYQLTRL